MTLTEVNRLPTPAFLAAFGDIAEHSPWVAERAMAARPFASLGAMIEAFEAAVRSATSEAQLALVRAHPDLATRARLTQDSRREQAGAGLDSLTEAEFEHVSDLNQRYKDRFGFPFIFAVKGAGKRQILASFESRLGNSPEAEFSLALDQVCRILRFRIEDRVVP